MGHPAPGDLSRNIELGLKPALSPYRFTRPSKGRSSTVRESFGTVFRNFPGRPPCSPIRPRGRDSVEPQVRDHLARVFVGNIPTSRAKGAREMGHRTALTVVQVSKNTRSFDCGWSLRLGRKDQSSLRMTGWWRLIGDDGSGFVEVVASLCSAGQPKAAVPTCSEVMPAIRPASQRTCRSSQSRDRSLGCGTSRWGRAGCRRGGRSPSSRWESSARPGNR